MKSEWTEDDVIASYSRDEAIADGTLLDVSDAARRYGLRVPVALTRAAFDLCVALSPAAERAGNDEVGRLGDVLWMLAQAVKRAGNAPEVAFAMRCVTATVRASTVTLRAVAGPGDDGALVLTVMLPEES